MVAGMPVRRTSNVSAWREPVVAMVRVPPRGRGVGVGAVDGRGVGWAGGVEVGGVPVRAARRAPPAAAVAAMTLEPRTNRRRVMRAISG